uniref:Phenylalanine-4-hydroxylase (inferred by orthology to a human protein) n=1 Tax=Strongyloides venezuelensis TaxID=75913 RepID=A0A0K0EZB1_STRVS
MDLQEQIAPKRRTSVAKLDTLVRQASQERIKNEGLQRSNTIKSRKFFEKTQNKNFYEKLTDDSVLCINASPSSGEFKLAVIFTPSMSTNTFLTTIVSQFSSHGINITHLETRPIFRLPDSNSSGNNIIEILIECSVTKTKLLLAVSAILENEEIDKIQLKRLIENPLVAVPWFPKHISELDKCMHVVTKYEPTEDPRHPGYGDIEYIKRRGELNNIANNYRWGDKLPYIEYTTEENNTWRLCYVHLKKFRQSHTCKEYRENIKAMEDAGVISENAIPQLCDLNNFLFKKTGFQLRPCGGLLSARDFLASLAFRVFQTTQYIRHSSSVHHSPEPDAIHEYLGHVPMFSDPWIAKMSQEIGLLSLGASDEEIEKLATIYWFIIEFGLCYEDGKYKAIGAGLISAFGELQHACSDNPRHEDFDPEIVGKTSYDDSDYQVVYFVANNLKIAFQKIKEYAKAFRKPFALTYNPYTQSIEVLSERENIENKIKELKNYLNELSFYLDK